MNCTSTQSQTRLSSSDLESFGVSYGKVDIYDIEGYNTLILEPDLYTSAQVKAFKLRNKKVIAYISLGEVNKNRSYFSELQEFGFLGENEIWNSYINDLDNDKTQQFILDIVIPQILNKGFDGLFLDTIDSASPYGEYSHLSESMTRLIKFIRHNFPDAILIQNAGFFLLQESENWVDAVAIESVATHYNFEKNEYYLPNDDEYNQRLEFLRALKSQYPDLPFIIIDFAKGDSLVGKTKSRLDTLFIPYFISEIELNSLPKQNISNN